MRTAITAIALGAVLSGCGLFDSGSNWNSGPFEVIWINERSDSHLAYRLDSTTSIGIVESCVFAAGANEQYVVVKQRPSGSVEDLAYYVVIRARYEPSREPLEAVMGPLSRTQFEALGKSLALPPLEPVIPEAACNTAA